MRKEEDQRLAATLTTQHRKVSIKEKIAKAQRLGWEVTQLSYISEEVEDLAWTHAEGYRASRIVDHVQGRCSLAASLRFDLAEEEEKLDCEIELMKKVLREEEE